MGISKANFKNSPSVKGTGVVIDGEEAFIRTCNVQDFDYIQNMVQSRIEIDKSDPDNPKQKLPDLQGVMIDLLLRTLCDETGALVFDPENIDDYAILQSCTSPKQVREIYDQAWVHCGFDEEEKLSSKEKNSGKTE